jgi:hypothetical protein
MKLNQMIADTSDKVLNHNCVPRIFELTHLDLRGLNAINQWNPSMLCLIRLLRFFCLQQSIIGSTWHMEYTIQHDLKTVDRSDAPSARMWISTKVFAFLNSSNTCTSSGITIHVI